METKQTDLISDEQTFNGAVYHRAEFSIQTYDDGYGPLWISRDSMGINGIVRAQTWEDAYSICEDEFFSEADETIEEIVKEDGFKRESFKVVKDSTVTVATDHCAAGERFAADRHALAPREHAVRIDIGSDAPRFAARFEDRDAGVYMRQIGAGLIELFS